MPPITPSSGPPEHIKETGDVLKSLQDLKKAVEKIIPAETPEQKRARVALAIGPVVTQVAEMQTKIQAYKDANPGYASSPEFLKLQLAYRELIGKDVLVPGVDDPTLISALSENTVAAVTLENLTALHLANELTALEDIMGPYKKTEGFAAKLFKMIPESWRKMLEDMGMDESSFTALLFRWIIAPRLEKFGIFGFGRQTYEKDARKKAKDSGVPDTVIEKGIENWNRAFDKWIADKKSIPNFSGVQPEPDTFIQDEMNLDKKRVEFTALKARFDAFPGKNALFSGIPVELQIGGSAKAVRPPASAWKILLPMDGFEENPSTHTFTLRSESLKLKSIMDQVKADPDLAEVSLGAFEMKNGNILTAELGGDMTDVRLKNSLHLRPQGAFQMVKLGGVLGSTTPTAKFENATLIVNYHSLNDAVRAKALAAKAAGATVNVEWHWDGANWVV